MKTLTYAVIAFLCAPLGAFAAPAEDSRPAEKASAAPFYEKYLSDADPGDRAIRELTRQAEEKPDDPKVHNDLGNLLARRGFAKEAAAQYREAERLDKTSYLPSYNEGLLWEKEGKSSSAIAAFRRSIRRKPGFPFSHFHLGVLEEKEGRESAAIAELAKALRIDNSLRLPSRNPLAVQTKLLHRASVVNYDRDIAAAVLVADGEFADPAVLARLSPERFIDSGEVVSQEEAAEPAPGPAVVVTVPQNAPAPAPAAEQPAGRPQHRGPNIFNRSRVFTPRPRTQFPPQSQPAPPPQAAPPPPAAAEQPPPEGNPENPPPPEEEPPPPHSR